MSFNMKRNSESNRNEALCSNGCPRDSPEVLRLSKVEYPDQRKTKSRPGGNYYRLHWLSETQLEKLYIPCRLSGCHFPDSMMGRLLALQYIAQCKPNYSYIDTFLKAFHKAIQQIIAGEVQVEDLMLLPGYSIQLNWLDTYTRQYLLSRIENILSFQRNLEKVALECQRLGAMEAVKLLLGLAIGGGTTLKELFLWFFFQENICPLIGHCFTDEVLLRFMERGSKSIDFKDNGFKVNTFGKKECEIFTYKLGEEEKIHSKNDPTNMEGNESDVVSMFFMDKTKPSNESKHGKGVNNEGMERFPPIGIDSKSSNVEKSSLLTWIERVILDDVWDFLEKKNTNSIQNESSTNKFFSTPKDGNLETYQIHRQACAMRKSKEIVEDILASNTIPEPLTIDNTLMEFEELRSGLTRDSEIDLMSEIAKRASLPPCHNSRVKQAKIRSIDMCKCFYSNLGHGKICSLCDRNTYLDLTFHNIDKLKLDQEVHESLHFSFGKDRIYFLDNREQCLHKCYKYTARHMYSHIKKQNLRMLYRIALAAFTTLTRLSINYCYVADGTGETLICIGSIREGKLQDLEILCTKFDAPSPPSKKDAKWIKHSIPNIAWKKTKVLCPNLRVHSVIYGMARYNVVSLFFTPDTPLTSLHLSTGLRTVSFGKLKLWYFDYILRNISLFHNTLESLTLHTWQAREKIDNVLLRLFKKLTKLKRLSYNGPIEFLETIDKICDFYLWNESRIIELKIMRIQDPCESEDDIKLIELKNKRYEEDFKGREIDFSLGTFVL